MKKIVLLLALLMLTNMLLVKAQVSKTAANEINFSATTRAQRGTVFLKKKFVLNDIQKNKVYDILLAQAKKIDSLKNTKSAGAEMPKVYFNDTKIKFKSILDTSFSKISALLTENQKRAFKAWTRESFYIIDTQFSSK